MKKVLIVEDESPQSNILRDGLLNLGFQVFSANNGREGLEVAMKERPDLITTDIVMPLMDGIDMIKELRTSDWGSRVPILILTNSDIPQKNLSRLIDEFQVLCMIKVNNSIKEIVAKINDVVLSDTI